PAGGTGGEMAEDFSPNVDISPEEEELIETIVEEKIIDIEDELENVYDQLESLKDRVDDLEQDVHDLKVREEEDEKQVVQKVDELEQYMEESQSRIGGLEKAFQQTLPSLVENSQDFSPAEE
ncbi:MAG: hypothetical protein SVU32_05670, partial [Candidatus Nanohaloarchaea archaeon]|nr:hypothetical protein [Candidatus Nanohaloarchaea archaeon]